MLIVCWLAGEMLTVKQLEKNALYMCRHYTCAFTGVPDMNHTDFWKWLLQICDKFKDQDKTPSVT